MERCRFKDINGNPIIIKPDGEHELDACEYVEVTRLRNVTVSILECKHCGHMEIAWQRQENTVEDGYEEDDEEWTDDHGSL